MRDLISSGAPLSSTIGGFAADTALMPGDLGSGTFSTIGAVTSGAWLGIGTGVSLVMLIRTLVRMKNEHQMSKHLNSVIDKLELERELYTRIVTPMKYHLFKYVLVHKINLF